LNRWSVGILSAIRTAGNDKTIEIPQKIIISGKFSFVISFFIAIFRD